MGGYNTGPAGVAAVVSLVLYTIAGIQYLAIARRSLPHRCFMLQLTEDIGAIAEGGLARGHPLLRPRRHVTLHRRGESLERSCRICLLRRPANWKNNWPAN